MWCESECVSVYVVCQGVNACACMLCFSVSLRVYVVCRCVSVQCVCGVPECECAM
jgi:hypothetical protein